MASYIKKGESILIPFRNGQSISDSQLKPRMYKTMQAFEKSFPGHYLGINGVELVEYAPVVRCKDCRWSRPKDHREPTDTPRELICQCFKQHHIPAPWGARLAVNPDDFCSYGERRT